MAMPQQTGQIGPNRTLNDPNMTGQEGESLIWPLNIFEQDEVGPNAVKNTYYGGTPGYTAAAANAQNALGDEQAGRATTAFGMGTGAQSRSDPTQTAVAGRFADAERLAGNSQASSAGAMTGNVNDLNRDAQSFRDFAAQGPGPSAAEAQLKAGQDANMRQAMSLARSGAAGTQAQGQRQAAWGNAAANQQTNQAMGQLRAQEASDWRGQQMNAMGQAAGVEGAAAGVLGAQASQFDSMAGRGAQMLTAEQQRAMGVRQQNDAFATAMLGASSDLTSGAQGYYGQGHDIANAQFQADTTAAQQTAANKLQAQITNSQNDLERDTGVVGLIGGIAGGLSGAAAMSDVRAKEKVVPLDDIFGAEKAREAMLKRDADRRDQTALVRRMRGDGPEEQPNYFKAAAGGADGSTQGQMYQAGAGVGQGIGALFAMSDVRSKTRIQELEEENLMLRSGPQAAAELRATPDYEYQYKDPKRFGEGRRVGKMAQDLEAVGPLGRSMVTEAKDGTKMVDVGKAALTSMSAAGQSARDVEELRNKVLMFERDRLREAKARAPAPAPTQPEQGRALLNPYAAGPL